MEIVDISMRGKKGQFFLLAAVIISAVVISLSGTVNRADVNEEPGSFYDFSYEVKKEVGAVLDYEIYSDFSPEADLETFVDLMAVEIRERSPGSDFIFFYGNSTNYDLKNYVGESVYVDGTEIEGLDSGLESRICLGPTCQMIDDNTVDFDTAVITSTPMDRLGSTDILVEIGGSEFNFSVSEHRQVIFIMQKNVGGDRHVIVE
jgi:hypothetical protein